MQIFIALAVANRYPEHYGSGRGTARPKNLRQN